MQHDAATCKEVIEEPKEDIVPKPNETAAPEDVKEPEEVKIEEKEKPKKDGGVKKKIHNVFSVIKKMLTDPEEEEEITDEN